MSDININKALNHLGGSLSLYRTLVQGFLDKYYSIDIEIRKALEAENYEEARRFAHSIKGLSGNLGAITLQEKAKDLESSIKVLAGLKKKSIKDLEEIMLVEHSFSIELEMTLKWLDCLLLMEDEKIVTVQSIEDIECRNENIESRNEEDGSLQLKFNALIEALATYNYEKIRQAFSCLEEDLINGMSIQLWETIKTNIANYEYESAKQILLEGIENEG